MMPDLDKLSKLAKVSCKFVIFCIFFPRRRSRTLVQNSVPGGTTIFVVGSHLKSSLPLRLSSACAANQHWGTADGASQHTARRVFKPYKSTYSRCYYVKCQALGPCLLFTATLETTSTVAQLSDGSFPLFIILT
jgi:hypothetical protein